MKKILKPFLISFVSLLIVLLLLAAFMPKEYYVERSIEMNAPVEKIFPLIADFSKWKEWSPWYISEPTADYNIEGAPAQIGSKMNWNGKIVGKGSLEIKSLEPLQKISMHLDIEKPNKMEAASNFLLESKGSVTIVTWTNRGSLNYPMGRLLGNFLDDMIGKDFDQGLEKIKNRAESSSTGLH